MRARISELKLRTISPISAYLLGTNFILVAKNTRHAFPSTLVV